MPRIKPVVPGAEKFASRGQKLLVCGLAGAVGLGLVLFPRATATAFMAFVIAFYVVFAVFKGAVTFAGRRHFELPRMRLTSRSPGLPRYGVLLPVHDEANMLRHLVARILRIDYPVRDLRVALLIEEDDLSTLDAARALGLRIHGAPGGRPDPGLSHVIVIVIPPGGPKTKPNAMNVGLPFLEAVGCEYVTIYDAEDRPDPDQLLKAVGTFRRGPADLACLQAELAFWNDDTNWITALYWIGYKIHFRKFLPGLAQLRLPVPLGGTSNHFKVSALRDVALPGGRVWDPHNLTEDADLGYRLAAGGYHVDLLRSVTLEEAPATLRIIDKQQRRWKGGYLQTGLVHTRRPLAGIRRLGLLRWSAFALMTLGTPLSFLINPLLWVLTAAYFATRSSVIEDLFPPPIYYASLVLLLVANFALLGELVVTCLEEADKTRGRFGLIGYMLLAQVIWLWMSRSTYIATIEFCLGKRTWHKTPHGHELDEDQLDGAPLLARPA